MSLPEHVSGAERGAYRSFSFRARAPLAQPRMPFGNFLVQNLWNRLSNSLSKLMFLKANSKIL